ncbi:MAG: type II secretion system GspH family protein [Candidatus Gastranaerophilales bacterium]|nr:type II secretion system GspH family protein [Candidatus Gastranaerophilales bacterium]
MFVFNKKSGFTLAEIMVTLGLIGAISALTIPTLAYNYRSKVLEEQFRSTYSDIKQIGAMLNYQKGDVGEYASSLTPADPTDDVKFNQWQTEFMSMLNGGNKFENSQGTGAIANQLSNIYKSGGGSPGPYRFALNDAGNLTKLAGSNYLCDNGQIWSDSKGRIWTFNYENAIICVDINGSANPNRYNIDIFAFAPMNARMVAKWVYDDEDNPNNYSGQIVLCNADHMHDNNLGNTYPTWDAENKKYTDAESALDSCPFNFPVDNIAPSGFSAKNKPVNSSDTYWKKYIEYK